MRHGLRFWHRPSMNNEGDFLDLRAAVIRQLPQTSECGKALRVTIAQIEIHRQPNDAVICFHSISAQKTVAAEERVFKLVRLFLVGDQKIFEKAVACVLFEDLFVYLEAHPSYKAFGDWTGRSTW